MLDIGGLVPGNPFVLAPMDGYTDLAFRRVCRRQGAGLCFTEMIPVMALVRGGRKALNRIHLERGEGPVCAQLAGNDPDMMSEGAKIIEDAGADIVDINAGCPSRRVINGGSGAALLSNLGQLSRILKAVRASIRVPLTVKVRSGPTSDRIVLDEVARIAEDAGVDAVTVHPRTRAQRFSGRADWSLIARFKDIVGKMTVIGNGDVASADDGMRMIDETGCDGVMIGRAAVGNPWLFAALEDAWKGRPGRPSPTRKQIYRTVLNHFDMLVECHDGDEFVAARIFRKHLSRYVRSMPGAVQVRRCLGEVVSRETLRGVLSQVFVEAAEDAAGEYGIG